MKILYISTSFPAPYESSTIYTDLAEALFDNGHEITVVVAEEKKKGNQTVIKKERGFPVLRVKIGNLYDVSFVEKGLTILTLKSKLINGIRKYLGKEKFDLILYESPPVTTTGIVKWAMKHFNCPSYLMLKDIFPQNAVDIGILGSKSPAFFYFRWKEKEMYRVTNIIGTMSEANRNYVLDHNPGLDKDKIVVFPNSKKISPIPLTDSNGEFRKKYNIPATAVLAVYGGNMGKPQGLDFLCEIMNEKKNDENIFFLLVGRGTERTKIRNYIRNHEISNALLLDSLPRAEYEELLKEADIGLIFLDPRFTIPNYPSRILSYFEQQIPVLAAIDANTDFGAMIEEAGAGYFSLAGDLGSFIEKLDYLMESPDSRKEMGLSGRNYLIHHFSVEQSAELLKKQVELLSR